MMAVTRKDVLKHLAQDVYCRLGVSKWHGVGVFALRPIAKGIDPLRPLVTFKETTFKPVDIQALPKSVRGHVKDFCYVDKKEVLVSQMGLNTFNVAFYLNHSKKPNVKMKKDGNFEALRNIRTGEELLMDYDHSFGDRHIFK